ncbi:GGDEF domain-containing protein [Paenibacillus sp. IHBB 10380]|uniref:GGDEF domain-containing protein n=1 Tax=Paenibacillus sp. IHBB 10380 TaxID=1566358 RepID=UPI00069878A8|nr:GGDEF domain-containing protein [Paenibacillus sp. IHBB 10380]
MLVVILISLIIILIMFIERAKLKRLAYIDVVTGSINRNGMDRFWNQCSGKGHLAVLFLDLDHFKYINDTFGHQTGDQLLKEVGLRLRQATSHDGQVFRIGGDEFVIIMANANLQKAELLASHILEKFRQPVVIKRQSLTISGSIGISIGQGSKATRSKLLGEADSAMYHAKRLGKNRYIVFNEDRRRYYKVSSWVVSKRSANL